MPRNPRLTAQFTQLTSSGPAVVAVVVILGYGFVVTSPYGLALGVNIAIAAIAAIGLTLTIGGAGQLALGQAGFMAIGSYGTAYLMRAQNITFVLALLASVIGALLVGAAVGYIALRLQGNYLAMATLAVGSGIYALLLLPNRLGGYNGYAPIPAPAIGSHQFVFPRDQYLLTAVLLVIVLLAARWLLAARPGRELAAIRDDETAARAIGVHITARKVQVFAAASAIGAIAGAINAPLQGAIDPSLFSPSISLQLFVMVVLGGLGNVYGAVLGAAIVTWLIQAIPGNGSWALTILGIVVVVFMAVLPDGLASLPARGRALARRRRPPAARPPAAGAVADVPAPETIA